MATQHLPFIGDFTADLVAKEGAVHYKTAAQEALRAKGEQGAPTPTQENAAYCYGYWASKGENALVTFSDGVIALKSVDAALVASKRVTRTSLKEQNANLKAELDALKSANAAKKG